ncbi:MAG: hypothetical protein KatS3mg030_205 [Saprospiraceae bacterium]|nr:MAG: hypothetical protein KatS3mg030_205 [Saprospiraceae bacterium]
MKTIATLLAAVFLPFFSFGQAAPDFTITASDGNTHQLYADYLDQGKTVVIEMMFTTCPPCNAFAPWLAPLDEKWGNGQYDVQFFSLSTQHFDTNASVGNWLSSHGVSFPGAGKDGGALTALQPYLDGQFGPFFGTPAFIVIAPDGSVNFNVGFGLTGQAKADAISAAIAATGAQLPPVDVHVKGTVTMPNGKPIGNITVTLLDADDQPLLTSDKLDFHANLTPGETYRIEIEKIDSLPNGTTTFDLVLITRHILAVDTLDFWQFTAADLNGSNTISTLDLISLKKWILGIIFIQPSWIFLNADCAPPTSNCDLAFTIQPGDTLVELSVFGVKMGDVNYSTNPNFAPGDLPSEKLVLPGHGYSVLSPGQPALLTLRFADLPAGAQQPVLVLDARQAQAISLNHSLQVLATSSDGNRTYIHLKADPNVPASQPALLVEFTPETSAPAKDFIEWKKE